jgi:prepilin-type N-terminal cleavage/methylation domain-containing protein
MILPDKYSPSAYLENRVCMRCLKVEKQIEDFEKKLIMMCVDTMNRIQKAEEIMLKSKGFTLIELLIVCAIISILVAIVVPQVSRYTKQVHLTCVSNSGRVLFDGPAKHVVSGGTNGTEWKFESLNGEKLRLNGQCVEKIIEKADASYRSLN